ncbi:MAG: 4-coumarate--CoA ligase family protein [Acidimicrobiia bacterium]
MAVITSPFPDVEIPDTPIGPYVFADTAHHADRTAIVDAATGRGYTYSELHRAIHRAAGGLTARGFGKGDVLAIMAPNVPEYAIAFHATCLVGGTVTTLNPTYGPEEVAHQLDDAGARFLVTIPDVLPTIHAAGHDLDEVFVFGEAEGATPFTALLASSPGRQAAVDADDVAVLPYSSGTTGLSKGVMLTHHNLVANIEQTLARAGIGDEDEVLIAVLPFFHIYGMQVLMNAGLRAGATIVTMPRFDLPGFLEAIQTYRVTRAYLVPPIILALAKHPLVDQYDLSSLTYISSGAAPLDGATAEEAATRVGPNVVQGYGMTELSPVSHFTPPGEYREGASGKLTPNTEARIVDPETLEDVPVGADGEIWVRGPQVMKGYLNNPEATAATITPDGWLRTGDIGHVDEDGWFFVVDRLKELIKYKGFQVPPAELEGLLLTHPAVADAAVIGIPDLEAGELPKAFVVLKPGATATGEELRYHVAEHVAHYKQLHDVEFLDEIPKSASGKILRRVLKDRG